MVVPADTSASAVAFGLPCECVTDELVVRLEALATTLPKRTSKRQQRLIAQALAYADELRSRNHVRHQFQPPS